MRLAKLILDHGDRFDVDVILPGERSPAFRLLLPESIYGTGMEPINGIHSRRATWERADQELRGSLSLEQGVKCSLGLKPTGDGVWIRISVRNDSPETYRDVRLDICANLCRLPRTDGMEWSNRDFIPESVPLDRTEQGKYWYSVVTPHGLKAWTPDRGWIGMHARPESPEAIPEDLYWRVVSQTDNSLGCAVSSSDGRKLFYQVWRTDHSRHQSPFAGNACMHLRPQVAEEIPPGKEAAVEGKAGIFEGTWEELAAEFENFISRKPGRVR